VPLVVGCGGSGSSDASAPRCTKPPSGVGPDATASLANKNAGGTYCLKQGDVLTVFLHAPVDEARWGEIATSPPNVLTARSTGVMTLPIGVTAGNFAATKSGTVTLRSVRPPCSPPAKTGCDAAHSWSARIVVG
jgi:hypothetical protein